MSTGDSQAATGSIALDVDANIEGLWVVLLPPPSAGRPQFWIGVLRRTEGGGFVMEHRSQARRDDAPETEPTLGPWDRIESKSDLQRSDALWHARGMALEIAELFGADVREVLMNPQRDVRAFVDLVRQQPWITNFASRSLH